MSDYKYDIFISYRRMDPDWLRWTQEVFIRTLRSLSSLAYLTIHGTKVTPRKSIKVTKIIQPIDFK